MRRLIGILSLTDTLFISNTGHAVWRRTQRVGQPEFWQRRRTAHVLNALVRVVYREQRRDYEGLKSGISSNAGKEGE